MDAKWSSRSRRPRSTSTRLDRPDLAKQSQNCNKRICSFPESFDSTRPDPSSISTGYVPPWTISTRLDRVSTRPRPVALVERASTHLDWSKKVEAKKASTPFDSFRLESSCAETKALVATFCAKQPLKCISVSSCNQVAHAANSRWSGGMPLAT